MNKILLVGTIMTELELKEVGEDKIPLVNFTLEVNNGFNSITKERIVDFLSVSAWNKNAENLFRYSGKGHLVSIIGSLKSRSYKNAEGQTRYIPEVRAERIQFLDYKKSENTSLNQII
ncbi:single-stranded DNA-binding protein [Clostridium grantii]|uniref:Single-stranded DNA-binding protein n=1 Tax=Clostridium grantii DSM 8605 TaxID=1121316 RepID=A0A1M5UVI1_9CLOT|nr:single-stranded DNA-binding protein [Clostridium grantii]SHH66944.1 single-strand DNA-binding protein [Clostridium grantii DSM 8605]